MTIFWAASLRTDDMARVKMHVANYSRNTGRFERFAPRLRNILGRITIYNKGTEVLYRIGCFQERMCVLVAQIN